MNAIIALSDVSKRYGGEGPAEVWALRDVTLSVYPGELVAIMGPSGSGKSTLLHAAAGLEPVTAGEVWLHGAVMPKGPSNRAWAMARRRRIGMVYQRLNLVATLTVIENVMLPLELDGRAPKEAAAAARRALLDCAVLDHEARFPDELSGGEQQRVAIARALVGDRAVLLADEPTGALDSATGEQVVELLAQRAAAGAAVVLATHDSRVASWADRVVFLRDGRIVDGTSPPPATDVSRPTGAHR